MPGETPLAIFCRAARARSKEHQEAVRLVLPAGLAAVVVGLLRQELDSLVRALYLQHLDPVERTQLLNAFAAGERWTVPTPKGKVRAVTDREMVDASEPLHGWAGSVYRFGCAFVHLSELHDHGVIDPMARLGEQEREDLLKHLRHYHHGPTTDRPTLREILPMLPAVMKKISANLEAHLRDLEQCETS